MSELKVDKITPRLGTTLTLGDSGDTINFGSGVLPNFENLTVTGDLTVDTNSLKVDSTNNFVGIGTASPSVALDVVGAITATGNITGTLATASQPNITSVGTLTGLTIDNGASQTDIQIESDVASNIKMSVSSTDYFRIYTSSSGTQIRNLTANPMIFKTTDIERMRIDSSGNVGIGTSSPNEKLEVSSSGATSIRITGGDSNSQQLKFFSATQQNGAVFSYYNFGSPYLTLINNGSERMRIDSSGRVGIGTTSPTALLTTIEDVSRSTLTGTGVGQIHISGGATPADNDVSSITFSTNNTTTASSIIGNQLTNNGSNLFFGTSGNYGAGVNNTAMFINYAGNVGIGTTSPSSILHLYSNNSGGTPQSRSALIIEDTEANGDSIQFLSIDTGFQSIFFGDASDNDVGRIAYSHTGDTMRFNAGASEVMRIDGTNNALLIGKTTYNSISTAGTEIRSIGLGIFTRDGSQPLILNRLTSDGDIVDFRKDGTIVGSISSSPNFNIQRASGSGINFGTTNISPLSSGSLSNNTIDLGHPSVAWNDLYLGGNIYLGGTGAANALDDYEEGTWTPTISGTSSAPTYYNRAGTYTKVGNLVTATLFLQTNAVSFSNNNDPIKITGYPFTPTGNTGYGYFIGSLSSQSFYYNGTYNDYGTNGVCHPEFQTVDSTIRFIVTASGGIRGSVKNLGMTVSGFVLQCWFQHYAT